MSKFIVHFHFTQGSNTYIDLEDATLLRSIHIVPGKKTYLLFIKFKVKTSSLEVFCLIIWGFVAVHLVPEN